METLNNDVLENILFRLPFGAASQAERVCQLWKTILDSKRHNEVGFLFVGHHSKERKLQLYFGEECDHTDVNEMGCYYSHETIMVMKHCRFPYKPYQSDILVGSCNGLVCFKKNDSCSGIDPDEPFAICNPLTGEYILLRTFNRVWEYRALISGGFGYCQTTDEYKVVRLRTRNWNRSRVQVYTIGSNEWRDPKSSVYDYGFWAPGPGIFVNSVLHWVVDGDDGKGIVAFDMEDEMFRKLPLPPLEVYESYGRYELKLLGKNLCLVKWDVMSHMDIWVYRRKYINTNNSTKHGMEEHDPKHDYYSEKSWGWVKEFDIDQCGHLYKPFAITKSNEVVLSYAGDLYCCDPKTKTMSKLGDEIGMDSRSYIEAIPHANSYVSLKGFRERWYGPESKNSFIRWYW